MSPRPAPPWYPVGTRLLDCDGDSWTWLGNDLPESLPPGREWLRGHPGPYLVMEGGSPVMPWESEDPMRSAVQRYGPFKPEPAQNPGEQRRLVDMAVEVLRLYAPDRLTR